MVGTDTIPKLAAVTGMIAFLLSLWRFVKGRKSLLSPEYPHEVVLIALSVGIFFATCFVGLILKLLPSQPAVSSFPWAVLTSIFAAPITLLTFYWKHLQAVTDRLASASERICDSDASKRASGYLLLEKIATENLSLAPTVIELLTEKIRYSSSKEADAKYRIDMLSRIWRFHAHKWWNPTTHLEPDLRNISIRGMELWSVYLKGFFLEKVDLSGCYLRKANLDKAILWNASLKNADLTGASFRAAKLHGADLTGTLGVAQEHLEGSEGNLQTILPPHLSRPQRWLEWCVQNKDDCFLAKDCRLKECQKQSFPTGY